MSKTPILLRGDDLLRALRVSLPPLKWLRDKSKFKMINPDAAILIVKAGSYEGKIRSTRVLYIRELNDRPGPLLDKTYWDDRAVIKFNDRKPASIPGRTHRKRLASLWDQMLKQNPPPTSWKTSRSPAPAPSSQQVSP